MSHIHELNDFVVTIFIVHKNRVLLVHHRSYNKWLPIGGHIELNEDPEEALYREVREECNLKVKLLSQAPTHLKTRFVKPIPTPAYVDRHRAFGKHYHIAFVYFGTTTSTSVRLCTAEHRSFRWFSRSDLNFRDKRLPPSIRFYAREALKTAQRSKARRK